MENIRKNLDLLNTDSPFSLFYEFGATPEGIKYNIIDTFSKYFINKQNSDKHAIGFLIEIWVVYLKSCRDHKSTSDFVEKITKIFNDALAVNRLATFDAIKSWIPDISHSISKYWSLVNRATNLELMNLEDFTEESFNIIGTTIEGFSKPYIRLLFEINRIRLSKDHATEDTISKDIGILVDELINSADLKNFFTIGNDIRLNQWRNISYHHKFKVNKDSIHCILERKSGNLTFDLDRDELYRHTKEVLLIHKVLNISCTLFRVDNFDEFDSFLESYDIGVLKTRKEEELLHFYASLASQGFMVKNIAHLENVTTLEVKDMQVYGDLIKRAIHSSQFIYNLWFLEPAKEIIVKYYLFDDVLFFISSIDTHDFEEKIEASSSLESILMGVKFIPNDILFTQNEDPFKDFLIDKNESIDKKYYSQEGVVISVEEFIRQFSLTAFCNYVVLISEGIDSSKIEVNIGHNGATIIAEISGKMFPFYSAAKIDNEFIQKTVIEKLSRTINLFNQKKLDPSLVQEALDNNQYLTKKMFIKNHIKNSNAVT